MNKDRLRQLGRLEYLDPKRVLENLRRIELELPDHGISEEVRTLRTTSLKRERESRDAAIFSYGMSCVQDRQIFFAPVEEQDFDFVTSWADGDVQHICPIQLKELVPEQLNPNASIDDLLVKLQRYHDPSDLVVAIKMNRVGRFDPLSVQVPPTLKLRGLWMFAASSQDQNEWILWGDFMNASSLGGRKFGYPKPMRISF